MKLLLWLTFAEHPLHIDYLADIVKFDMDDKAFNSSASLSSPDDVLVICSSLVTKMDDHTVQLAHASVKQYILERPRTIQSRIVINPLIGNRFVGLCCLAYLLHSRESCPSRYISGSEEKKYANSMIRYAAKNWSKHILTVDEDESITEQMKKLFVLKSFAFRNWVRVNNNDKRYDISGHMKGSSLLHCAAFHGLTRMVEWFLPTVYNESEVIEALSAASKYGHAAVARVLLGECRQGQYGNTLEIASLHGHKQIIELLLEKGADVNAQGGCCGNALQAASFKGHKEVVELLLEKGADDMLTRGDCAQLAHCYNKIMVICRQIMTFFEQ